MGCARVVDDKPTSKQIGPSTLVTKDTASSERKDQEDHAKVGMSWKALASQYQKTLQTKET